MNIHLPTLILVIVISGILNIFILLAHYKVNKKNKGILQWVAGFTALVISQFVSFFLEQHDDFFSVIISDILLVTGFLFIAAGLKLFFGSGIKRIYFIALFSLIIFSTITYYFHRNDLLEQISFLSIIAFICFGMAYDLYKQHKTTYNKTTFLLTVLFAIYGLIFFSQVLLDIYFHKNTANNSSLFMPVIYIASYITITVAVFSLIILINNQLIAERQTAINALQTSEANYRNDFLFLKSILESPQDIIIFSLDANRCYTEFTSFHKKVMKKLWGKDIFKGMDILSAITTPDDRDKFRINFDKVLQGEYLSLEEIYGDQNLYRTFYEVRYSPLKDTDGKIAGMSVFVIDITKRKAAEKEMLDSKKYFEIMFKSSPDAAMIIQISSGKIIEVNDSFEIVSGFTRNESVGNTTFDLQLWVNIEDRNTLLQTLLNKGVCKNLEVLLRSKNGDIQTGLISARIFNIDGIPHMITTTHDITQQKKAAEEKEFERRDKEALINSTTDLIWSVSSDFKLIAGNKAFIDDTKTYTGKVLRTGDSVISDDNFPEAYLQYWQNLYQRVLAGNAFHTVLEWIPADKNNLRWTEFYMNPIKVGEKITGVACFGRDISERKLHENAVKDLNNQVKWRADELAASNKELEQFAYIASHDLQEPLRMVNSFLLLLEKKYEGQLDETALQYIHYATDGATRMRQIILDLLEYSRVGKIQQQPELLDMSLLMKEIIHLNSIAIQECNASIQYSQLPAIIAVKLPVQQVIQNLVSNALKYRLPAVAPVIKINALEQEDFWQFEVADNGIGISPAFFEKIFVVFQRLHSREEYSGTGLGLAICKKTIEMMGGKIWVESTPGEGSRFFFTIKK
jgi:PAS domain S-box-containing protein